LFVFIATVNEEENRGANHEYYWKHKILTDAENESKDDDIATDDCLYFDCCDSDGTLPSADLE